MLRECLQGLHASVLHGLRAVSGGYAALMVVVWVLPIVWPVCIFGSAGGCGGLRGVGLCGAGCGWCLVAVAGGSVGVT